MRHSLFTTVTPAIFKAATVITQSILGKGGYSTKYKHCCALSIEHTILVTRVQIRILFLLSVA